MTLIDLKNCELVKHLIEDLDNNADWLCFFVMFSRFEYALKRAKYLEETCRANPSWEKLSKDDAIKNEFNKIKKNNEELEQAIEYLKKNPPKIQIQNDFNLGWDEKQLKEGDFEGCIDAVKRVRNNLFHGGKYPLPYYHLADTSRDKELIQRCIIIMKYFICSSNLIKTYYLDLLE